jgi:hypothetical protein
MVAFPSKTSKEVAMGLIDSMIVGGSVANGVVGLDVGTALWLLMVVSLVASGLGIVAKAHTGRPLNLGIARHPKSIRLAATPNQLCEVGGV